jgi:hypothetical protein
MLKLSNLIRSRSLRNMSNYYDDLDWLLEQGIIFEPEKIVPTNKLLNNPDYQKCVDDFNKHFEEFKKLPGLIESGIEGNEEAIDSAGTSFFLSNYYRIKEIAFLLREVKHMDAYPVFTVPNALVQSYTPSV